VIKSLVERRRRQEYFKMKKNPEKREEVSPRWNMYVAVHDAVGKI
jgi:hypothetical protein